MCSVPARRSVGPCHGRRLHSNRRTKSCKTFKQVETLEAMVLFFGVPPYWPETVFGRFHVGGVNGCCLRRIQQTPQRQRVLIMNTPLIHRSQPAHMCEERGVTMLLVAIAMVA